MISTNSNKFSLVNTSSTPSKTEISYGTTNFKNVSTVPSNEQSSGISLKDQITSSGDSVTPKKGWANWKPPITAPTPPNPLSVTYDSWKIPSRIKAPAMGEFFTVCVCSSADPSNFVVSFDFIGMILKVKMWRFMSWVEQHQC